MENIGIISLYGLMILSLLHFPVDYIKARGITPKYLGSKNPRLHIDETLTALSISAATDKNAVLALQQLPKLKGCEVHTSSLLSQTDENMFRKLGVNLTMEPKF